MDDLKTKREYLELLLEKEKRKKFFKLGEYLHTNKFLGPFTKNLYPKHIELIS